MSNRTEESLLARRKAATRATPGPWTACREAEPRNTRDSTIRSLKWGADIATVPDDADADHIAASDPTTVTADIDEILQLRRAVSLLEQEADWLAEKLAQRDCPSQCEPYELVADLPCVCTEHPCEGGSTAACWRKVAHKAVKSTRHGE